MLARTAVAFCCVAQAWLLCCVTPAEALQEFVSSDWTGTPTMTCTGACSLDCVTNSCDGATFNCDDDAPCWVFCTDDCDNLVLNCPDNSDCYIWCGSRWDCPSSIPNGAICEGCAGSTATVPVAGCLYDDLNLTSSGATLVTTGSAAGCVSGGALDKDEYCIFESGGMHCESMYCLPGGDANKGTWSITEPRCSTCLWAVSGRFPNGMQQCADGSIGDDTCGNELRVMCGADESLCTSHWCRPDCSAVATDGGVKACPLPTLAPATVAPPTMTPTDAPPTDAPSTNAPSTDAPPTEAPSTSVPSTDAPPTNAPPPLSTFAPTTRAPETSAPMPPVAATEPPAAEPAKPADSKAVNTAISVGSVAASPTAGKLAVLANLDCKVQDVDLLDAEPIDWEFHPFGWPVGSTTQRYYLGAVFYNFLIVAGVLAVQAALSLFLQKRYGTPRVDSWGAVRCPSMAFIPFMFLYQGVSLSTSNMAYRPHKGDWLTTIVGCSALAVCFVLPVALYYYILRPSAFRAGTVPDPRLTEDADEGAGETVVYARKLSDLVEGTGSDDKEGNDGLVELIMDGGGAAGRGPRCPVCGKTAPKAPASVKPLTGWKRSVYKYFFGERVWMSTAVDSPDNQFVERYGVCFEQYREGLQFFVVFEMGSILGLSVFSAWRPDTSFRCHARNSMIVLLLLSFQALIFYHRPYLAPFDNMVGMLMASLMTLAVLLMTIGLGLRHQSGYESAVSTLFDVSTALLLVAAFALLVKAVYDLANIVLNIVLSRKNTARRVVVATCKQCRDKTEKDRHPSDFSLFSTPARVSLASIEGSDSSLVDYCPLKENSGELVCTAAPLTHEQSGSSTVPRQDRPAKRGGGLGEEWASFRGFRDADRARLFPISPLSPRVEAGGGGDGDQRTLSRKSLSGDPASGQRLSHVCSEPLSPFDLFTPGGERRDLTAGDSDLQFPTYHIASPPVTQLEGSPTLAAQRVAAPPHAAEQPAAFSLSASGVGSISLRLSSRASPLNVKSIQRIPPHCSYSPPRRPCNQHPLTAPLSSTSASRAQKPSLPT
ncbi:hypothetical protein DIPPA_07188 [Diplonema papillatum]|nr:hypothetical protein DIPPA_07188 [Diplonema papillatum]